MEVIDATTRERLVRQAEAEAFIEHLVLIGFHEIRRAAQSQNVLRRRFLDETMTSASPIAIASGCRS